MHLHVAEQMLTALAKRPEVNGRLHTQLCENLPAFYFGNIAPDFPAVCNFRRSDSHFHHIPPATDEDPFANMLAAYPHLRPAANLDPGHAVFIGAYGAHLLLDVMWFHQVVIPYFVEPPNLGERSHRRLLHFSTLTYLDRKARAALPAKVGSTLNAAPSDGRLPFGRASDLRQWRDLVAEQLFPGAASKTVEIFAGRLSLSPAEFAANLDNRQWMETVLFPFVPIEKIELMLQTAVPRSIQLLTDYLFPAA